jgi:predicted dehydrogenase
MNLSRRIFLDHSLAAAAVAALSSPGVRRLSAEDAESSKPVGPNDKVRVAVIGVNGQGGAHLGEWLRNPGVEVVAVCDCDPAAYAKHEGRFKDLPRKPRYEQDVRKLLEDKSIDAVSIATPNHWHALMAVWAMQAGKDVYVEKPCSHTVHEGRVMTQWARKLGRMCQMGVQSRSMPGMRATLDFVLGGKLGKIQAARAICYRQRGSIGLTGKPAPIPTGLDFDLWCGPAPLEVPKRKRLHYDWHWFFATGGGDIANQNPHELDKARWGLGKQELPRRVVSLGGRLGYVDDAEVANCQVTVYEWDDALLISDVRGLPIKSPITMGLKTNGFNGAMNVWYGEQDSTTHRAWRLTMTARNWANGVVASTKPISRTFSRPCGAETIKICISTSKTVICRARWRIWATSRCVVARPSQPVRGRRKLSSSNRWPIRSPAWKSTWANTKSTITKRS